MTDLYTSQTISNYNPSAPPDDGSTTSDNLITWDSIKTELVDPVKTLAEAIDTQTNTALAELQASPLASLGLGTDNAFGLNTVLKTWHSAYSAAVIGNRTALWGHNSSGFSGLSDNVYYDGAYKYKNTAPAIIYEFSDGIGTFKVAPSGTADTVISPWATALTINNNGSVTLGTALAKASGGTGATKMPFFNAYLQTSVSSLAVGWHKVTFDTERYDPDNYFASSRWTPAAGYYDLSSTVYAQVPGAAWARLAFYKNGSAYLLGDYLQHDGNDINRTVSIKSGAEYFNGTDYMEVYIGWGGGGGDLSIIGAATTVQPATYFTGHWIG